MEQLREGAITPEAGTVCGLLTVWSSLVLSSPRVAWMGDDLDETSTSNRLAYIRV